METAIGTGFVIFIILIVAFLIAARWRIHEKAGHPGWSAIVPIYNIYILTKIIGKPGYWVLLMMIPLVNIVYYVWATNLLSKSFGKDEGFTAGLILLSIVFYPILGFGAAQYIGAQSAEAKMARELKEIGQ